jgi:hypothetical protein
MRKILRKYKWLHYLGVHNKDCMRKIFTERNAHLCLRTGNIYKFKIWV